MSSDSPNPPNNEAAERLAQAKARMQGVKSRPLSSTPVESPAPVTVEPEPEPDPEIESGSSSKLPSGLLARFRRVNQLDAQRYRNKPWQQLPDESPIEYALFREYLLPEMARGRDIDTLADRLNAPELTGWLDTLISTAPVPNTAIEGYGFRLKRRKDNAPEDPANPNKNIETRLLWWLAGHNYWMERGKLYDAWQIEVLVSRRKSQMHEYAQRLYSEYVEHTDSQLAILQEIRNGILAHSLTSKGQLMKVRRRILVKDASGMPVETETEYDPTVQFDTMFKLADRIFGPLPNMLDGDVTTTLGQSIALPDATDKELTTAPKSKLTNAPWLLNRVKQVQSEMEKRAAERAAEEHQRLLAAPEESTEEAGDTTGNK